MRPIRIKRNEHLITEIEGMLSTGFEDVDNHEIFEGDKVEVCLWGMGKQPCWGWFGTVTWKDGCFCVADVVRESDNYPYRNGNEDVTLDELREYRDTRYIPNWGEVKCNPTPNLVYARKI